MHCVRKAKSLSRRGAAGGCTYTGRVSTPPSASNSSSSVPLNRLLGQTADAVQAVRDGRSLTDVLARCPAELRPGTQALSFTVLRLLGSAQAARAQLAPKTPPPRVDSLLLCALALLWPVAEPAYAEHTVVDQAVQAMNKRAPAAAGFVNAVLRRFLRERDAVVAAAQRDPQGAFNHPPWWIERVRQDWPTQWQAILQANNTHPPMTLRVNVRQATAARYVEQLAAQGRRAFRKCGWRAHSVRICSIDWPMASNWNCWAHWRMVASQGAHSGWSCSRACSACSTPRG